MTTLQEIVDRNGLTMRCRGADSNPHMPDSRDMDHWRCTIRNGAGRRVVVTFSMGSAHKGREPELLQVLDCLASDATADDMTFADFCGEFGYSEDSRSAERTYKACLRTAAQLKRLVSEDYEELLYRTERL